MKRKLLQLFLILNSYVILGQVYDFKEKFTLPNQVSETSGLLFINGKIVTHNDSGDNANLYEIDANNGSISRTIQITNANNNDWEDIAESNSHIFVGDFGNNNGTRDNLRIYKILKSDYINNNSVTAEIINFSFEDQTNFSTQTNNHNFDAEAMIVYNNQILIFTKNWQNQQTNVYKLPLTIGTHVAEKVSSANVQGLITGATRVEEKILLCGYSTAAIPFLVYVDPENDSSFDVFRNGFERYNLISELGVGSQIEAITMFESGQFYLSRESLSNQVFNLSQKLYEFKDDRLKTLSIDSENISTTKFFPNPTKDAFQINSSVLVDKVDIFNVLGKKVLSSKVYNNKVNISNLQNGMYVVRLYTSDSKSFQKKIIKF